MESLFKMVVDLQNCIFLKKEMFSYEFCESFKNIYYVKLLEETSRNAKIYWQYNSAFTKVISKQQAKV